MIRILILGGCAFLPALLLPTDLPREPVPFQGARSRTDSQEVQEGIKTAHQRAPGDGGAGLLIHCKRGGKHLMLLGHDRRGWWEILGGHTESRQSLRLGKRWETPIETASRESFEESRMVLPYHETLRKAHKLGASGGFTIFTLEVSYIPRKRFLEAFVPTHWKAYDEMDDYAWVEVRSLIAEIGRCDKGQDFRLRSLDGKRELRGLRPALFAPLKKLTALWKLLLGH